MSINMKLSDYEVTATHTVTGEEATFVIQALDAGEAIYKVEKHGVWAVDDFKVIDND